MQPNDSTRSPDFTGRDIVVLDKPFSYHPTLDIPYVVLGFLHEYLGRRIVEDDEIIERFFPGEVAVANAFEKFLHLFQNERGLKTPIERIVGNQGHIVFASRELTTVVNSYYTANLEIDRTSTYFDKGPFLYASNELPYNIFEPLSGAWMKPEQYNPRFSFLYGAYQRYGSGNSYIFANSGGKADLVRRLLSDVGCEYVGWKAYMKGVPTRNEVEFEPTEDLRLLFNLSETPDAQIEGI